MSWPFGLLCFSSAGPPLGITPSSLLNRLCSDSCSGNPCIKRTNTSFCFQLNCLWAFLVLFISPLLLISAHFLQRPFVLLWLQHLSWQLFLYQEKKGFYEEFSWSHFQTTDNIRRERSTVHPHALIRWWHFQFSALLSLWIETLSLKKPNELEIEQGLFPEGNIARPDSLVACQRAHGPGLHDVSLQWWFPSEEGSLNSIVQDSRFARCLFFIFSVKIMKHWRKCVPALQVIFTLSTRISWICE